MRTESLQVPNTCRRLPVRVRLRFSRFIAFVDFEGDGVNDLSFRERDFRVRSLRGNSVLRWEYRPGSTLYVVWQQSRYFEDREASEFGLRQEFGRLLGQRPENVLILKMNYWLSL